MRALLLYFPILVHKRCYKDALTIRYIYPSALLQIQAINLSQKMSAVKQEDVKRPTAKFPPSVWGDQFLVYDQQEDQTGVEKVVEDLKEEHTNLLKLVDAVERLGIDYYFEDDIKQVLQHFYDAYMDNWSGGATSVWVRIMRQHGFFVSSAFKEPLESDIEGLLEFYEATYLRVPGEVILDDALAYTRGRLDDISKHPSLSNSMVSKHIQEALKQPLHKRVPRIEALRYIPFYEQQKSHNKCLLKLAKLGFNLLQSPHKKELSQIYCKVLTRFNQKSQRKYELKNFLSLYSL
ncbi:putative alpha-isocomene synthase [Helianthus anomalus]